MGVQATVSKRPALYPARPVLVVDDDEVSLRLANAILRMAGLNNILTCQDSRRVLDLMARQPMEIVFLDLMMPYVDGEALLRAIAQDHPNTLVIVVTGTEDVNTAVRCIKEGAFDYMTKPIEFGRLSTVVKNALAFQDIQQENVALKQYLRTPNLNRPEVFAGIITRSSRMLALFQNAEAIAQTHESVLITGETGVGKDLFARAIHELSGRRGAFVAVNVAGLDDNVFADTLFGHGKGAFTSAERARAGLIEQAAAGTLMLDEIGDLTAASQAKLLRLLQEGDYFSLGQDTPKRNAARIVSATNRDLWQAVEQGQFRKDLNFRLRTHHLHLPPLRERLEDLSLLIEHFLDQAATQHNRPKPHVPESLVKLLEGYSFPGNVRELRMMVLDAASRNTAKMLPLDSFKQYIAQQQGERNFAPESCSAEAAAPFSSGTPIPTLKQATEQLIREALQRCKGNQSAAAKLLGISQQAISKRLKKSEV